MGSLRHTFTLLLVAAPLLGLCGCREQNEIILFHAGAGQRSSLNEVKAVFEQDHPDVAVNFSYKGSGYFLADIARSKEGDLYMPGEEFYLLQAVERGFIADYDPQRDIAGYFVTVIITPRGNPKNVQKVEDFAKPGVKVGLGDPKACAIGMWHEKTFRKAGIWEEARQNASFSAKCIPELGNATQHKLIDATIVWATTAVLYLRDVEIIPIEPRYRGVVRLPVATLTFSKHPEEARMLRDLILSHEGKQIFLSHAYAVGQIPRDEQGFAADGGRATQQLMTWLVNAAKVVKDESLEANEEAVGPLIKEVKRQRKTTRAGT
jgi:molybdate transport system substrate-binding protein